MSPLSEGTEGKAQVVYWGYMLLFFFFLKNLFFPPKTSMQSSTRRIFSTAFMCQSADKHTMLCLRLTDNKIISTPRVIPAHTATQTAQSNLLLDRFQNLSSVLHGRSTVQPMLAYFQVSRGFYLLYLGIYAFTSFHLLFNNMQCKGGNGIFGAQTCWMFQGLGCQEFL